MPTTIFFAASRGENPLQVRVREDVNAVFAALNAAGGRPFELTSDAGGHRPVWVNPATVAYWQETASSSGRF